MARAMRLRKQTGTVSVEQVWSFYKAEFPVANRCMTPEYFNIMSSLLFMRFNLTHFKKGRLPPWLEGDSLMATKLDTILSMVRSASGANPGPRSSSCGSSCCESSPHQWGSSCAF